MAYLEIVEGPQVGRKFELAPKESTIGRLPICNVVLPGGTVSREHARIRSEGDGFFLEDLGSVNGTGVNGSRIHGRVALKNGDRINIFDITLEFRTDSPNRQALQTTIDPNSGAASPSAISAQAPTQEPIVSQLQLGGASGGGSEHRARITLQAILDISRSIGSSLNTHEMLPRIMDSLFDVFPQAQRGYILQTKRGGKKFRLAAMKTRMDMEETISPISSKVATRVIESGTAYLSGDVTDDSNLSDVSESIFDEQIRSVMCAPLTGPSKASLGVIHIETNDAESPFSDDDLEVLASVAVLAGQAVDHAYTHESLMRLEAQKQELELAKSVQLQFLPREKPKVPGYSFFHYYSAAREVAGDFFDYIPLSNDRLAIMIADVSGKGASAALFVARLCSDVRYCVLSTETAANAMTMLNQQVCREAQDGTFITAILGILEPANHRLTLVNAGHIWPFVRRDRNLPCEIHGEVSHGLPLGVDSDWKYEQETIDFEPGNLMALFTDGVTEALNPKSEMYGLEGTQSVIEQTDLNPIHVGRAILADVKRFAEGRLPVDDLCLVCFGRDL